jgi:hypothetical protein
VVDSEEEDEEEAWAEVEVRSFVITAHSQVTWKGTIRTLVLLNSFEHVIEYCPALLAKL